MLDCPEYTYKMLFLIGDVSNIGLFFDKIGKTMLQQMSLHRKYFLENKAT